MPHEAFLGYLQSTLYIPLSSTCVALYDNHFFLTTVNSWERKTNLTIFEFSGIFKVPAT